MHVSASINLLRRDYHLQKFVDHAPRMVTVAQPQAMAPYHVVAGSVDLLI